MLNSMSTNVYGVNPPSLSGNSHGSRQGDINININNLHAIMQEHNYDKKRICARGELRVRATYKYFFNHAGKSPHTRTNQWLLVRLRRLVT